MELDDYYFDGGIFLEVVEPRSGVLIPPCGALHTKKSPHVNANSSSKDGGEGGIASLRSPSGQFVRRLTVCPTGCASCRTPVGGSHPPLAGRYMRKKKPAYKCELLFEDGGEGGIDSLRSPCGQLSLRPVCPTGCASCRTQVGGSHPPWLGAIYKERACMLMQALSLKDGGEGGIRTPDTLPYTHFPGVLLQPLGHLTILYCQPTLAGQRGATIGSWLKTVKNNLSIADCSLTQ